eukprot:6782158-Alexandrium_andersonii.AAC.1
MPGSRPAAGDRSERRGMRVAARGDSALGRHPWARLYQDAGHRAQLGPSASPTVVRGGGGQQQGVGAAPVPVRPGRSPRGLECLLAQQGRRSPATSRWPAATKVTATPTSPNTVRAAKAAPATFAAARRTSSVERDLAVRTKHCSAASEATGTSLSHVPSSSAGACLSRAGRNRSRTRPSKPPAASAPEAVGASMPLNWRPAGHAVARTW